MGENNFAFWPVVLYGILLMRAAIAYYILAQTLIKLHGENSTIAQAIGKDRKGLISLFIYAAGVALCYVNTRLSLSFMHSLQQFG